MSLSGRQSTERAKLPYDLAALTVEVGLLRVEHLLSRKYDPNQPRTPAGQTGGGQWTSGDGGQEVVADDGSRVLSLRIRSRPSETWDEQHTVVAPDGARTVFEMEGRTQTVRDGETGEILSRATLVDGQVEPEAFVQGVRAPPAVPLADQGGRRGRYGLALGPLSPKEPGWHGDLRDAGQRV